MKSFYERLKAELTVPGDDQKMRLPFQPVVNHLKACFWFYASLGFFLAVFNFSNDRVLFCPDSATYEHVKRAIRELDWRGVHDSIRPVVFPFLWLLADGIKKIFDKPDAYFDFMFALNYFGVFLSYVTVKKYMPAAKGPAEKSVVAVGVFIVGLLILFSRGSFSFMNAYLSEAPSLFLIGVFFSALVWIFFSETQHLKSLLIKLLCVFGLSLLLGQERPVYLAGALASCALMALFCLGQFVHPRLTHRHNRVSWKTLFATRGLIALAATAAFCLGMLAANLLLSPKKGSTLPRICQYQMYMHLGFLEYFFGRHAFDGESEAVLMRMRECKDWMVNTEKKQLNTFACLKRDALLYQDLPKMKRLYLESFKNDPVHMLKAFLKKYKNDFEVRTVSLYPLSMCWSGGCNTIGIRFDRALARVLWVAFLLSAVWALCTGGWRWRFIVMTGEIFFAATFLVSSTLQHAGWDVERILYPCAGFYLLFHGFILIGMLHRAGEKWFGRQAVEHGG